MIRIARIIGAPKIVAIKDKNIMYPVAISPISITMTFPKVRLIYDM
jgi:hypothetical protein